MNKGVIASLFAFALLIGVSAVYAVPVLSCSYSTTPCANPDHEIFDAHDTINSEIAVDDPNAFPASYNYHICCSPDKGNLAFFYQDASSNCPLDATELFTFSDTINARLAEASNGLGSNYRLCATYDEGLFDVQWGDDAGIYDYSQDGYRCIAKVSDVVNGEVSTCDATFAGGSQYRYTLWGRFYESLDNLNCNLDCTSSVDNRIYAICGGKLPEACSNVHFGCNGALYGSWVGYNFSHEVECAAPWDNYRNNVFTNERLNVTTTDGNCDDLIKREFSVLLEGEVVTMSVFVCGEQNG